MEHDRNAKAIGKTLELSAEASVANNVQHRRRASFTQSGECANDRIHAFISLCERRDGDYARHT
jgi:hypothetical protein